jgi:cytochrome c-type biogenesis protein CcmF
VSLGDFVTPEGAEAPTAIVVRVWWKPQVTLIWIGSVIMAFGGLISLSDRRLRVGAPKPHRQRKAAGPVMEPAE